ncbi:MAG: hypothetical protein KDJ15_00120 [Alphaproteobacteria bacterium]|nr:hypothetical protein [Alphaproteobacteria bacterium]
MPHNNRSADHERGNAFLLIMLGIALFAALIFTVSQGTQEGTGNMTRRQAEIAAADILDYAQRLERGAQHLQARRISENNISFENDFVAGYSNANCSISRCKIFDADGGAVAWKAPPVGANDGSDWVFTGANYVKGLGAVADQTDAELLAILPNVTRTLCAMLNEKLGIDGIPQENADSATTKYQGSFATTPKLIEEGSGTALDGVRSACFEGDTSPAAGTYHFYHVLLQRP